MAVELHPGQSEAYEDLFIDQKYRFISVCCARGWGKSYFLATAGATAVFELMHMSADIPNKRVALIAPTYDQVTDIYFPILAYDLGLEDIALFSSRAKGIFLFPNNVELRLLSYEAVERMRGKGYYFVGWDEVSSCSKGIHPKDAWQGVIQPCIVTRWSPERAAHFGAPSPGRAAVVSTPDGYNFFHELHHYAEADSQWGSYHYDYTGSPYIDPDEVERIRHQLDPRVFAAEYLASFEDSGNNVFYCFKRKKHVTDTVENFRPESKPGEGDGEDVHVCIDFNVGIMAASMFARRGSQFHFIDEMQGHPDTEHLAIALKAKYLDKGHKVWGYPDPTGRARKTSAAVGRTDFAILESYGIRCLARQKSPPLIDSVNAVNKNLMTAAGDISMYFHPRCKGTIESMERTKWVDRNPDTAAIDKSEGVEHFSDGIRYAVEYIAPVQVGRTRPKRGFSF
jgi:hypothetical protein